MNIYYSADTGSKGTPLSYAAVSGRENELLLYDYRNFEVWTGFCRRYKHLKAWHFYSRLSFHWVKLNTVRYIHHFFTGTKSVSNEREPMINKFLHCSCPDYLNFEEQEWRSQVNVCLPTTSTKGLVKKYRGERGVGWSREGVGHQFLNPW